MSELSELGKRMVYSGIFTREEMEEREAKIHKELEAEDAFRRAKRAKEQSKEQEIEKARKQQNTVTAVSAALIVGLPGAAMALLTGGASIGAYLFYGAAGIGIIPWFLFMIPATWYYKKKIQRLERELENIKRGRYEPSL